MNALSKQAAVAAVVADLNANFFPWLKEQADGDEHSEAAQAALDRLSGLSCAEIVGLAARAPQGQDGSTAQELLCQFANIALEWYQAMHELAELEAS